MLLSSDASLQCNTKQMLIETGINVQLHLLVVRLRIVHFTKYCISAVGKKIFSLYWFATRQLEERELWPAAYSH